MAINRQGKVRLAKWFTTLSPKDKAKIVKDVSQLVLARRTRMCNFLEYKDTKIVYRRYASLFFIAGCSSDDNELITLEIIHRYVEQMDKYYGNVCELDIIFSFTKAYYILDEILLAGELQESSKKNVLRCINQQDSLEDMEVSCLFRISFLLLWLNLSTHPGNLHVISISLAILRPLTYIFSCSGRGRGDEDHVTNDNVLIGFPNGLTVQEWSSLGARRYRF
ncbi:clathrin adaptor complex small chain-domain-containing protein [Jackrogersella minutella]|nr:clathrin adaptor complex small chain-domain-containing protein [Jackrogersella minutella]